MKLTVISAGLSEHSSSTLLADRLREATAAALAEHGVGVEAEVFELKTLIPEIGQHYSMGFPSGRLAAALDAVRGADAVIAVSPIFKASYSGLFKSFWDLVDDDDLRGTPTILAATGGTARHSLAVEYAMRPLFSYLKADVMPTSVFAATDDFGGESSMEKRIARAGAELAGRILERKSPGSAALPLEQSRPQPQHSPADQSAAPQGIAAPQGFDPEHIDPELMDRTGTLPGAVREDPASARKASGLPPLKLVPFDQLLGR